MRISTRSLVFLFINLWWIITLTIALWVDENMDFDQVVFTLLIVHGLLFMTAVWFKEAFSK